MKLQKKLLSEEGGRFPPSVCMLARPGEASWDKNGRDPREAGRALSHDSNLTPSEGGRKERKQCWVDTSLTEVQREAWQGFWRAKIAVRGVSPRNRPASEALPPSPLGKTSLWEV